ncbi:GNAT family N-acetyltransferase [Streptomyces kaempferi]
MVRAHADPAAAPLLDERGLLGGDENMLSVTVDDTLAGRVEWFRRAWGRVETSACWEIAIGLFAAHRGQGIGTQAQRLLVDYLFTHTRAERVQVCTDADNLAEQRAAEKAASNWKAGSAAPSGAPHLARPAPLLRPATPRPARPLTLHHPDPEAEPDPELEPEATDTAVAVRPSGERACPCSRPA